MIGGRSAAAVWRQARRVTHYHVTEGRRDTRQATRPPTSAGGCGRGAARVTDLLMSLPRRGGGKKYKNVDGTVKCQHGGGRASQDYLEPFVILPALLFVCMCVCVCVWCLSECEVIPANIIEYHPFFRVCGSNAMQRRQPVCCRRTTVKGDS